MSEVFEYAESDRGFTFTNTCENTCEITRKSNASGDLISRQDAIDELATVGEMLKRVLDDMDVVGIEREKYAWGLGLIGSLIEDMRDLPSADASLMQDKRKIDASSDLISRQDAIDEIDMLMEQSDDDEHDKTWNTAIRGSINAIKHHVPSVQRTGKWIEHHEPYTWMGYTYWTCSECACECGHGKEIPNRTNCCYNCGARMV